MHDDSERRAEHLLARRLHDLAGDVRGLRHELPDIEDELAAAEAALERAAARAETEH